MDVDLNFIKEAIGLSIDDTKFEATCASIANSIKIGKYTLTQLVQDLGPLLTNSTVGEREKGMLILSMILSSMPEDILTSTQLNYICNFYADRLNDHHQVVPVVIKGLTPLVCFKNIPEGLSTHLLNSLFQHVPCQQQQQHDRYNIYVFIKTLLDKRKEEMKAMGLELVYGIISSIDSERDPRNLLFLFNWLPHFLKTFELGQLTEEMFDVMSCYFPVDFRPTAQDENSVTRETLANALCPCLCSLPAFAELCIPLALEKLESELRIAKLDSLDLLIKGSNNFPLDSYKQHCSAIWSLIQKEVLGNKQDKDLEMKCLQALTVLFKKISTDLEFTRQVTKDTIDTLKGNLRPDALLNVASWKLVKSISQASGCTAKIVFKETSSFLINMYSITITPTHKSGILEQLVEVSVMYLSTNSDITIDDVEDLKLIPNICLKAMTDTDPQIRFVGISSLSRLAPFIPSSTRTYFYQNLSPLIILEQDSVVRNAILCSLKVYAELYHEEVKTMLEKVHNNGLESLPKYLEAVGSVVCITELVPFSIAILVDHVFKSIDISAIAVEILKTKLEQDEFVISKYLIETEHIIDKVTDYLLENVNNFNVETHNNFLNNITRMLMTIIRHLNGNDQEILITKQIEKVKSLQSNHFTLVILYGLVTSLKPPIRVPIDFFEMYNLITQTNSSYICNIGSQLLASIINKTLDEKALLNCLAYVEDKSNTLISSQQNTENVITIISFTTKALVLQSSPLMFVWVEKLIHLSASNVSAAKALNVMLDESHDCLSTKNYCRKRLLYKQKFFAEISNYLVSNYDENHKHYLTILGYLLQNIPQQILRLHLKQIIRLLLLCLSYSEDTDVLLAVLSAINVIIKDKEQLAEDYIQEFLKYYLRLVNFKKSMKVRILALKGLQLYSEYPLYKLLPMKHDVLLVLGTCLDDKKRLVRKEAVEARSRWFLIDAPI